MSTTIGLILFVTGCLLALANFTTEQVLVLLLVVVGFSFIVQGSIDSRLK